MRREGGKKKGKGKEKRIRGKRMGEKKNKEKKCPTVGLEPASFQSTASLATASRYRITSWAVLGGFLGFLETPWGSPRFFPSFDSIDLQ